YNGFPSMYADFAVHCTWEGDNTILALQSGRSLIASYLEAKDNGKKFSDATAYMNDIETVLKAKCAGNEALNTLEGIEEGWATVAAHAVKKAAEDYVALVKAGKNKDEAFEACSQVRFVAASIHSSGYIYRQFKQAVERLPADAKDGVRQKLEVVAKLYGLWQMEEKAAFFLRSGWLSAQQLDLVQARVSEFCAALRKFAIPLIDAFALSDHIVNSPIGVKSGDIYREYFRAVRRANPQNKEHPYFERVIKPFLFRNPPEMDDADDMGVDDDIEEIREELEEAEKDRLSAEKERAEAEKKATVE
ncbi:unnamed protein product, partial [Tilletia controversa]